MTLLHALPLDARMWEPQRAALAQHEVLAPDLYGLGSTIDQWAEAVLAMVEGPLAVVGASMGGYCALAVARRAPERVAGLVLAGSRADADPPERRETRAAWIRAAREEGADGLWREIRPRLFPDDADPEVVARARAIACEQRPDGLAGAVEAIRDRTDASDVVTSLRAPLLVVAGEADPLVPAEVARETAASAPRGRAVVLEGAGHLPSLERPDEFNAVLLEFLESL